ncbi:hypothetical protein HK102_010774, partial [Quaeritorhiza haematococci]
MHRYGGVYADLDMEAVQPMDALFKMYEEGAPAISYYQSQSLASPSSSSSFASAMSPSQLDFLIESQQSTLRNPTGTFTWPWWAPPAHLNKPGELYLAFMSDDYAFDNNLPNAWMASRPGHSFWMHMLVMVERKLRVENRGPEFITGPTALMDALRKFLLEVPRGERDGVTLLEP